MSDLIGAERSRQTRDETSVADSTQLSVAGIPAAPVMMSSRVRRWAWILILATDAGMTFYGIQAVATPAMMTPGYESFTDSSWTGLVASTPAVASYVLLLYRLVGGLNVALGLVLIAVTLGAYRRGARWAWFTLLAGNAIGFGLPMTYDQITGAIGPFEILEFLAVGIVLLALLLFPWERPSSEKATRSWTSSSSRVPR